MSEVQKAQTKAMILHKTLHDYRAEIVAALPRHVSPDRMLRIAFTSARKNPDLLDCSPESFLGAVIQSAQLGLEPDTPLGHAYLLPFYNSKTGTKEVNFMPGYRGMMDLIYRVSDHPILAPAAVYEGDEFYYEKGLNPVLKHIPMPRKTGAKLTHGYCVASFADGRKEFIVMNREEIEACRARSKSKGFSPWQTDYEAMVFKTVIRRFCKYLPMSAEVQRAVGLDDLAEAQASQGNDAWAKAAKAVQTKAERINYKMGDKPPEKPVDTDPESFGNFGP